MHRRHFLGGLGRLLAGGALACRPPSRPIRRAGATLPNLVFLLADDLRADATGYAGNRQARTPNLDALARESTVFSNAFVTTSICWTSRASILTGQYASRHGCWRPEDALDRARLGGSFPALLRLQGYQVAFVGKWGVGTEQTAAAAGAEPAALFDQWGGFWGQGDYWEDARDAGGEPRVDGRHLTHRQTAAAIELLQRRDRSRPYCLWVSYKAPHVQDEDEATEPFQPALSDLARFRDQTFPHAPTDTAADFAEQPPFIRLSEMRHRWQTRFATEERFQDSLRRYHALTSGLDTSVGELVEALRRSGDWQRTVLVFASDNGFFLGEHGLAGKWLPQEESIRIPLLIRRPENSSRPATVAAPALNIDIAPTLLELAGMSSPDTVQGRSLVPWLVEQPPSWRSDWLYEFRWVVPESARRAGTEPIPASLALRTERYAYMTFPDEAPPNELLYDLDADPWQDRDLMSAADPELLRGLRARLAALDRAVRSGASV